MQRLVDTVLGNAKESIKTFTQESFQNTVRVINGFSALVLAFLPGKGPALDGIESHSTFRAPRLPRWMEEGVSSFNAFLTEYDTDSEESNSDESEESASSPSSPSSESSSHLSRDGSSAANRHHRRNNKSLLLRLLLWMLWPLRLWNRIWRSGHAETRRSSSGSLMRLARRWSGSKEFTVPKSVADRRRGIIEDLQLVMELFIERVFDVVLNVVHHVLSPFKTLREFLHWAFFRDTSYDDADVVEVDTLGDSNPHPQKQKQVPQQSLNTDNRTCQDIITSLGYPYEAHRVTTDDGHVLLLERIPRRNSRKAVILQHGVLDSSLSWVSNGVVGSQAFAAFDQGYDVYLGNLRGLASREHVDKDITPKKYWNFSINEHGTQDIPAMVSKIHELKMQELESISGSSELPYRLCGVAHSLGGGAMLMYVVTKCLAKQPHYLSRLILLSPAGFHGDGPLSVKIAQYVMPLVANVLYFFTPGMYIPTRFFRALFNKLSRDFQNYPALGGLAQALLSYLIGGDSSNWVGAMGVSHYNINNMPGVSVKVGVHFAQIARRKRFLMYDYGREGNLAAYGIPEALDIGAHYGVIDIPVDLVAGKRDKLIPPSMVRKHFETMEAAGCQASYSEFEFAHLDFTFANREELMAFVTSRLSLVAPVPGAIIAPLEETVSSKKLTGSLSERQKQPAENGHVTEDGEIVCESSSRNEEILEEVPESSPSTSKLKSS